MKNHPALRAPLQRRGIAGTHLVAKATPEKIVKKTRAIGTVFEKRVILVKTSLTKIILKNKKLN
jgi:hypothetical protein